MKKLPIAVFAFFLFCSKNILLAQISPDAGAWITASLEGSINKKFGFFLTEEMRLKDNFTRLNLFYTNVGLEYKINKHLKTSLAYRPTQKLMPENYYSYRHRLQWDVTVKKSFGKFDLSYRHRLQTELKNIYSSKEGKLAEWYSRSKFQVKLDLDKPITPYVSIELRYQILDPRSPESDYVWHRVRYLGGFDYKINSHHTMGLYYLKQEEFNIIDPEPINIVGLEYTYKFK